MIPQIDMTKTDETKDKYEYQAELSIKRFLRETNNPSKFTFNDYFNWFISKIPTWQHSTVRQYKSSVLYFAKKNSYTYLEELFETITYKNCKSKAKKLHHSERKTRSQGAKSVSPKNIRKIYLELKNLPTKCYWKIEAVILFRIILLFGMRRKECINLQIVKDYDNHRFAVKLLKIINAKHTNLRAHGKYRHIELTKYSDEDIQFLIKFIKKMKNPVNASGKRISAESYITRCSKAFSEYTKELFPKRKTRINLYTARHQFCANLKKMDIPFTEAAALMGHAVTDTHIRHYGRRRSGFRTPYRPIALESEVAKIRVKNVKSPYSNKNNKSAKTSNKNPGKGPAK